MLRAFFTAAVLTLQVSPLAAEMTARDGWVVEPSTKSHADLADAVRTAAKANKLGVVTQAGPTGVARDRGVDIPENLVIGLFNNVYAVRILNLSTAAMIEAPVRMYVTEAPDGTATLSYKTPSFVFAPYVDEGGPDLVAAAAELDAMFAAVAAQALE